MIKIRFTAILLILVTHSVTAIGQIRTPDLTVLDDPRGPEELRLCSLNLNNFGSYKDVKLRTGMTPEDFADKESALVTRIFRAKCDVVALQEVLGKTEILAQEGLAGLVEKLRRATNRIYDVHVGPSNDSRARVGYLVATDRARVVDRVSYAKVELPKIDPKQRVRLFARGPLELQLLVYPREESYAKKVTLVNFHFKSKSTRGGSDPAGLEFEPYRMEMSEALRRILEVRHAESLKNGEALLVLLGDRNSHWDSASARILEGILELSNFQKEGACRLNSRGVPLCKPGTAKPQQLFSVLTTNPRTRGLPGTIRYKGVYSWIDDILLPTESLPFAWEDSQSEGSYESGVEYEPEHATDHALVWVGLNW